jgi:hypothetical protein
MKVAALLRRPNRKIADIARPENPADTGYG